MAQEVKSSEKEKTIEPKAEDRFWVSATELRREFDRLFGTLMQPTSWLSHKPDLLNFRPPWNWTGLSGVFSPAVDLVEKDNDYVIVAEIPGVAAEDLSVDISGETLTIAGAKTLSAEHKDKNFHIQERNHGAFQRSFPLPRGVDSDKIKATFDQGLRTVTLPKANGTGAPPKKVAITTL